MDPEVLPNELFKTQAQPPKLSAEKLTPLILRFMNRLKMTGKSSHTISAYRNDLNLFTEFLRRTSHDPAAPSATIVEEWAHFLSTKGRNSQASQRRALMSVRTFMHFLVESKILAASPFLMSKSPKQPKNDLFCITSSHFKRLCQKIGKLAHEGDEKAIRDLALVLVLGKCGLKASEAAGLSWKDARLSESGKGTLIVRTGQKSRLIPLSAEVGKALRSLQIRSADGGSFLADSSIFFGFQNVSRKHSTRSMQRHSVKFVIYELCESLLGLPYNSESLGNHAVLDWLKKGWETKRIAELAGYSSLQSLERFAPPDSTLAFFRRNAKRRGRTAKNVKQPSAKADRQI